ncbi:MAG: hypothetical protein WAM88_00165 [Nitrososphaeraceae archaeon]
MQWSKVKKASDNKFRQVLSTYEPKIQIIVGSGFAVYGNSSTT